MLSKVKHFERIYLVCPPSAAVPVAHLFLPLKLCTFLLMDEGFFQLQAAKHVAPLFKALLLL